MATITVRGLDDQVQNELKRRATEHGRSMEAEVRAILSDAVTVDNFARAWIKATSAVRGADLVIPPRSPARSVDLT